MRITFLLASAYSLAGGARIIANWAYHLHRRGHQVLLVARPPRKPSLRERMRAWRVDSPKPFPQGSHYDGLQVPRVVLDEYRPILDRDVPDADVVIATWWETSEWVAALSPRKGAKAYLIQHHEVFDHLPKRRVAATYELPLYKMVVADWLERVMREQYGDPNVSRIQYGIDRALFDAPPRGKQPVPTVGFMYTNLYWKGCDVILKAIALAREQLPNLRIAAFGAQDPIPVLPLPRDTFYARQPPQTMLRELYAQCDAWLFGSRSEGFAAPPLEAMACRTPVIGTPAGGEAELIERGGLLVRQEDAAAMARRILDIAAMPDAEWRSLSDTAYQLVAPYTWERATDQLEAALQVAIDHARQNMLIHPLSQ